MNDLRLQVIFTALDKVTGPLKKIHDATEPTSKALKTASDRLKELNTQQKALDRFRDLHQGLSATADKLNAAQSSVNRLAKELHATATPTRAMTREFNAAVKTARSLKTEHASQNQQLQLLRDRLSGAGISTSEMSKAQTWLKNSIRFTNAELTTQQTKLTAIAAHQNRVAGAKARADKLRSNAGSLAMTGAGALVAGRVMATPVVGVLDEAKHYQLESGRITSLGLGAATSTDAEKYARNMKTYGTSHRDNLELVRDAMSVFGDLHHAEMVAPTLAKMKFGNQAFYGAESGAENQKKFMDMLKVIEVRGGLASPEKFQAQANMVQKVITATGGRVGPEEWLNLIKTGGVAAKGLDDQSFYYQMEPLVQELGGHRVGTGMMSAYNNLYQGHTTKRAAVNLGKLGLIGDTSKVKLDKVGQTAQLDPGALLGSELFKTNQFAWMEQVLLPQLAKHGITEKGKILDRIGSIFSNRTAGDLFANMVLQRAQIHKNEKLNAGAYGIDQLNNLSQQQASGKELEAAAKLADLKLVMGEKILPIYTDALVSLTGAVERLNSFMDANPALGKAMIVGFAAIAGILTVAGPLMLGLAALMGPYALLSVLFARLGFTGGLLKPVLQGIGTAVVWLGKAFLIAGRALLMNPIGLTITAIALAAVLIYQYWEPIKAFFIGLWTTISTAFMNAKAAIITLMGDLWSGTKTTFFTIVDWFNTLPAKFGEIGSNIMAGLVNGITGALGWVKSTITNAGESVIGWFKDKLGIHSPSKVFAALGDYTMQGYAVGLHRSENAPLSQISNMSRRLTQLGAGLAIGAAALPAGAIDTRPPLAAPATAGGQTTQGDTIYITINPSAGMDETAIARAVQNILEQRDRDKRARSRSRLADY